MSKYSSVPLFLSVVYFFILLFFDHSTRPSGTAYLADVLDLFNAATIAGLFVLLAKHEKSDAKTFGDEVRANMSTLLIALLINFLLSATTVFRQISDLF
ncbi:hypothetical protein [Jiella sonneratiae]|uniref:Uncharacterized protein n=1 Tax=Jiella sonneratiae TaxID=2816856 RepID=A0ABS3J2M4_9HYPH|nr:hypothetical protein [Jiella sonneratiae]MBO0903903.1 hypothetical protein [Jiella sonneratiae]